DDGSDILGQLRLLVFRTLAAVRLEVLQAADPGLILVHALADGVASPAEAAFRLAGVAATEGQADLGLEEAPWMAGQPLGPEAKQVIVLARSGVHDRPVRDGKPREKQQLALSRSASEEKREIRGNR